MFPLNAGATATPTDFRHGSSEVIFHDSLLAPVSHPLRLAGAFALRVLSSSALFGSFCLFPIIRPASLFCQAEKFIFFFIAISQCSVYTVFNTLTLQEKGDADSNTGTMESTKKTTKNKRGKLYYSFQAISMIPLLIYGIVVIIFSSATFRRSMQQQVYAELKNVESLVDTLLDTAYPGDYTLEGDNVLSLYKGGMNITADYSLIDGIKENTGMDVTLFYQDTRILTTIKNWEGERLIGTRAPEQVLTDVLEGGESRFYDKVIIKGTTYFAYYAPLYNGDGQITGILFVGKPAAEVNSQVNTALSPMVIVGVLALILVCLFSMYYAGTFLKALYGLRTFISRVSTGNLSEELDPAVLKRGDELTELGRAALSMQRSLRSLVERDSLTELYNRRSGGHHLTHTVEKARSGNAPFTLVIADIDFFKKVNDTYGHQCGDLVLQNVARILRRHMKGKGYAIRWGGEEFLLVYENSRLEEARKFLETLQEEIRNSCVQSEGNQIYITMTFGMACNPSRELKDLLREADDRLYYGKNNGRDQIVSGETPSPAEP